MNHNELALEQSYYETSNNGTLFEGGENVYQPYSTYEGGYDGKGGNPAENPATDMQRTGAVDSNVTVVYCAAIDGATLIGTQIGIVEHAIRIVSGVDMLYYSKVGFTVKCGDSETVAKSSTVFSSIEADGEVIEATELGVGYLATLTVNSLDSDGDIDGKSFTVTPVVNIGELEIVGESVSYRISLDQNQLVLNAITE